LWSVEYCRIFRPSATTARYAHARLSLWAKPDPAKDEKVMTPRLPPYQAALDFLSTKSDKGIPNWIFGAGAGVHAHRKRIYDNKYYPKPAPRRTRSALRY